MLSREEVDRLAEIKEEFIDLLDEARSIARHAGDQTWERARLYWLAHIRTALDKEHDYLGGSMFTMQDTIDELTEALAEGAEADADNS